MQIDAGLVPFFATFTLRDCRSADVGGRADLLVGAFKKLLRKRELRHVRAWSRAIEVKTATPNHAQENVHLHAIWFLPPGSASALCEVNWNGLWQECADDLARDAAVAIARNRRAVLGYLTKSHEEAFREDAEIGIKDPRRYVYRVLHRHLKYSFGGLLRGPARRRMRS
jgi:hypothetical protein